MTDRAHTNTRAYTKTPSHIFQRLLRGEVTPERYVAVIKRAAQMRMHDEWKLTYETIDFAPIWSREEFERCAREFMAPTIVQLKVELAQERRRAIDAETRLIRALRDQT